MIDGILIPYHREKALKFPKISTCQKVTISEVSYIIYLYKGESKTFSSKIEFLLLSANSMLVIASAGFNIEQAVIYKACENMNHSIHLIPQEGMFKYDWI